MVLYGKNSVLERLKTDSKSIKKIFLQDNFDSPYIVELIKANNIPIETLSSKRLSRIKPAENLQGIVAKVERFAYASFDDLLNNSRNSQLNLIFLDRLYDPQNLGSIIRTTACFGNFAIVIPRFKACEINETVIHIASGGENYVPISMVSNLSNAIIKAKEHGYWIIGAVVRGDAKDIDRISLLFPLGIVLGSEGEGIRYGVEKHLDAKVCIPMKGAKLSFNVTSACAIFCHEITKQKVASLVNSE